jgi:uncharacterized ubiquitin-like protein YukD
MTRVVVTVDDGKGHSRDLDLPADLPVQQLTPALAQAIAHPDLKAADGDLRFILKFVNSGEVISPEATLASAGVLHGDLLRLLVKATPAGLKGAEAPLRFSGPGFAAAAGPAFPLRRTTSTVGRADPGSGIVGSLLAVDLTDLDDPGSPSVSRRHAQVIHRQGEYFLTDLRSTNGTYLNGQRLEPDDRARLHHGDQVRFGDVSLTFVWDSQE